MVTEGQNHTRDQIHATLGGTTQSYLPVVGGRVVCACLEPKLNPGVPKVIILGTGPTIEKTADLLIGQKGPIPVLLRQGSNAGRYVDEFEVAPRRFSTADFDVQRMRSEPAGITRVIRTRSRVPLHPARSTAEVLASASRHANPSRGAKYTSRSFRQNTAWVCAPEGALTPATWAMQRDVVDDDYVTVTQGQHTDVRLSESATIESLRTLGRVFSQDEEPSLQLIAWASTVEAEVIDHVDEAKLRLVPRRPPPPNATASRP